MKKNILLLLLGLIFIGTLAGCATKGEDKDTVKKEIVISAAASLREALEELKVEYENNENVTLTFNFGASGSLQKQIEEGAPADIFISAGEKQFIALEEGGYIEDGSKKNIVNNDLVLIVNKEYEDEIKSLEDLESLKGYIAIGEIGSVPAGQYAEEVLTYYNKWTSIEKDIVYAKDVKQVVSYVESGEAACGIVYKSDAIHLENSTVAMSFDEESHKPISYPGGIIKSSKVKKEAELFLKYLTEGDGAKVLEEYGFKVNNK